MIDLITDQPIDAEICNDQTVSGKIRVDRMNMRACLPCRMGTGAFVQIVVVFSGQCAIFAKTAGCQASASVIGSEKEFLAPIQCDMAGFHSSGDLQIILERKLAGAGIDPIGGNMPGFLVLIGTVKHIVPDGQKAGVLLSFRSGTQSKTTGFSVQDILVDTFASGFSCFYFTTENAGELVWTG